MKQKSGYFSNIKNIVMFVICMLFLFAIVVCSTYLLVDSLVQAKSGAGEYVPNYSFLYVFAGICIAFVPYLVIYLITVFLFFYKNRSKQGYQPSVEVKVKGDGEEIENLTRRFGNDVLRSDMHSEVPLYIHVSETHDFPKKVLYDFSMFLLLKNILLSFPLLLALVPLIVVFVFPVNLILFFVVIGLIAIVFFLMVYIYFYFVPKKITNNILNNKLPTSIRVFDDRIEEASMLMDGSEISYVFKYNKTKMRETKDYIFIKGTIDGKEKTTAGLLIDKNKVEKEIIDFILKKYKNK